MFGRLWPMFLRSTRLDPFFERPPLRNISTAWWSRFPVIGMSPAKAEKPPTTWYWPAVAKNSSHSLQLIFCLLLSRWAGHLPRVRAQQGRPFQSSASSGEFLPRAAGGCLAGKRPSRSNSNQTVLRQMKANESEVLLLRDYVGTEATREQFIKTFATASSRRASKRPRSPEREMITRLVGKIARKEAAIASLARMKAEAELASLYRERAIARAWATRRDPNAGG